VTTTPPRPRPRPRPQDQTRTRRAVPNLLAEVPWYDTDAIERRYPGYADPAAVRLRYGAELLGRILGHAGADLHDFAWYQIYAAAAYDGLDLCPTLHIMAAQAMDETRTGPPYGDIHEERARELTETGVSVRRTGPGILQALREALTDPSDQAQP
jgi:hypothetical protein